MVRWFVACPFIPILILQVCFILTGYFFHYPNDILSDTECSYLDSTIVLQASIDRLPVEKAKTWQYIAHVKSTYLPFVDTVVYPQHDICLYVAKDSSMQLPRIGDVVLVRGRLTRPTPSQEEGFDYGQYLRLQHIVGTMYVDKYSWYRVGYQVPRGVRYIAYKCQQMVVRIYHRLGFEGKSLGVLSALTIGCREDLDRDTKQSFVNAGAMHILAVSGLHTGIVFGIITWLLAMGGLYKPLYSQRWLSLVTTIVGLILLWGYAFITGLSPSVLRAVCMLTILALGIHLHAPHIGLYTLVIAAVIILFINPLALFSTSFQLSFGAIIGIILFSPILMKCWPIGTDIGAFFRDLIVLSVSAQLGTLPLTLYYFGQTSNYFILTNILVIPITYIIITLALIVVPLALINIHFVPFIWLLKKVVILLCISVEWIEGLKGAVSHLDITPIMVLALYGLVLCAYFFLTQRHFLWVMMMVLCVVLFCKTHYDNMFTLTHRDKIVYDRTVVKHYQGTDVTTYPVDSFLFATYKDTSYVFVNKFPRYKREVLQDYCDQKGIVYVPYQY